jgi:hypothetical protein
LRYKHLPPSPPERVIDVLISPNLRVIEVVGSSWKLRDLKLEMAISKLIIIIVIKQIMIRKQYRIESFHAMFPSMIESKIL